MNSNPETSGYEQLEKLRKLAGMPDFLFEASIEGETPFIAAKMKMVIDSLNTDGNEK